MSEYSLTIEEVTEPEDALSPADKATWTEQMVGELEDLEADWKDIGPLVGYMDAARSSEDYGRALQYMKAVRKTALINRAERNLHQGFADIASRQKDTFDALHAHAEAIAAAHLQGVAQIRQRFVESSGATLDAFKQSMLGRFEAIQGGIEHVHAMLGLLQGLQEQPQAG